MRYRKKPVVIEAYQLTEDAEWDTVADWCEGTLHNVNESPSGDPEIELRISTLEGVMTAGLNDWIIRGVQGEFYPCKPAIFEATYEPVAAKDSCDA